MLNTNLILAFKDFIPKIRTYAAWSKIKISSDSFEGECTSQFEGTEYESDIYILQFVI